MGRKALFLFSEKAMSNQLPQINERTPKWFALSLTVWIAILAALPQILPAFGIDPLSPEVQRIVQAISGLVSIVAVIAASVTEKTALMPPAKAPDDPTGGSSGVIKALLVCILMGLGIVSPLAFHGCAQTEENRVAQSVIATKVAADTALHLHAAGVTTPEQELVILGMLRDAARAEDAYYDAIRAGDGAKLAAAKAAWAVASQRLTAELAKYPVPQTKPIVIPPIPPAQPQNTTQPG